MQLLSRAHPFEYRTTQGQDHWAAVDVWLTGGDARALLVFQGVPVRQMRRALRALHLKVLPYLLRPEVPVQVLTLRPPLLGAARPRRAPRLRLSA